MGMALPRRVTYVIWSIKGVEIHREEVNTMGLSNMARKIAVMQAAGDVIDVRYETVDPLDFRSRAERRGHKQKKNYGTNRKWWNKR